MPSNNPQSPPSLDTLNMNESTALGISISSSPPSTLLSTRHRKKQASHDTLLLSNRIALLRKEETKALKRVTDTKLKVKSILHNREVESKEDQERVTAVSNHKKTLSNKHSTDSVYNKLRTDNLQGRISRKNEEKQSIVDGIRRQKQVLRDELVNMRTTQLQSNQTKIKIGHNSHDVQATKKSNALLLKLHQNKQTYDAKIKSTESSIKAEQAKVVKMERVERMLIESLKEAQRLQKEAFGVLEDVLVT